MWQDIESVLLVSDGTQIVTNSETHRYLPQPSQQHQQQTHQHLNSNDLTYVKQEYNQITPEYDYQQNESYEQSVPYIENNVSQWSATNNGIQ